MILAGRLALRIGEFAEALGVSRSKAYEVIAAGEVETIRVGGCKRIPVAAALEYVERQRIKPRPSGAC